MNATSFPQLIPVLQVAIGPVILISGVGLVLIILTTRLGRAVDRVRELMRELRTANTADRDRIADQIKLLFRRARLVRGAIALAGTSVLLAAILVITLFLTALLRLEVGVFVVLLFIGCMLSLIAALAAFMLDIQWALKALSMELDRDGSVPLLSP